VPGSAFSHEDGPMIQIRADGCHFSLLIFEVYVRPER
jgi:hypothetical protein